MSDGTNWREIAQAPVGVSQLGTDVPVVPIGTLLDYVGAADPADTRFLLADGRELNRTTYASLFSVMSTTYGTGNGTTTFNIPDCRGRTSVGPDNMGTANGDAARLTANDARGNSGGEEKHTLTTGELPSHTHRIAWTLINEGTGASFSVYTASGTPDANGTGTHRTEANDTPRGAAHNVMQPYIVLNKIIRVS
jgi:microcystin-dependent protein